MREIGGILYANDGDWVESMTALVEHADGRLEIVDWSHRASHVSSTCERASEPDSAHGPAGKAPNPRAAGIARLR